MSREPPQPLDYEAAGKRNPQSKLFTAMAGVGLAWAIVFGILGVFAGVMASSGMADEPGYRATWVDGVSVFCIVGLIGLPGAGLAWLFSWLNYRPRE